MTCADKQLVWNISSKLLNHMDVIKQHKTHICEWCHGFQSVSWPLLRVVFDLTLLQLYLVKHWSIKLFFIFSFFLVVNLEMSHFMSWSHDMRSWSHDASVKPLTFALFGGQFSYVKLRTQNFSSVNTLKRESVEHQVSSTSGTICHSGSDGESVSAALV